MTDNAFGDIYLDGSPYRIDFQSWRGKDIVDFSPRATVPGGSFVMSDLGLYQPLVQTDWRHGFGFHWYSDAMGYLQTVGNIDTRQDGLVMMFTGSTSSDTDNSVKYGMVPFANTLFTWGAFGLRQFVEGVGWSSAYNSGAVNFAMVAGDYLFFCPDGARIKKMNTSGTITDAGLDANATDYKWLIVHNGYIYAGKDSSNAIHFDNSETLATLQGNASDTNRILVGVGISPTLGAMVYNGNLYVRKSDGVWVIGEDKIARRMLDFSAENSADNLRSWAVINGYVVMPLRDRILQWNGARVSDITPHKVTDTFPYVTYGRFNNFVAVGDYLYCTARTNETTYDESLLCFDGVGWHKLCNLITDSTSATISMLAYEAINNRLWYHLDTTSDVTYYIQFQNLSTFPYASFPTTGQHSLITSRIDAGFRRVTKSIANLLVETANCSNLYYISIYYSLDGGSWIFWKDIKENGVVDLSNPGGRSTREFNWIQFRFDFVTTVAGASPILEGFTMRFIMRPLTKMGYNFAIIAANNTQYGLYEDNRTPQEIYDELMSFRNSANPITLTDMFGVEHTVYLTAIQEQPIYRNVEQGEPMMELRYQINCVEV